MSGTDTPSDSGTRKKRDLVYTYLVSYIDQKKFSLNTRLPSENFLCARLDVSRETVRAALRRLSDEGLVFSVKGSGTYFKKSVALLRPSGGENGKLRIAFIAQGQDIDASSSIIQGVRTALNNDSVELKTFITDNKLATERKCLESCSTGFHGLIVDGVKASVINPNLDCYSALYEKGIRIIFFNNYYMHTDFPKVIVDDASCADALVRKLVEKGHTRIVGIFVYDNYQGIEKYKGYFRSLVKYGGVVDDKYVKWYISDETYERKHFSKTIMSFLRTVPKATAIVCCNYMILKMLLEVLESLGKKVPDDYSVVCFDYSGSDWRESGITCSIHPGFEMGMVVGQRILMMVSDGDYASHDYSCVFPPDIYEGRSIKALGKV